MKALLLYSLMIGSLAAVRAGEEPDRSRTNTVQLTTLSLPDQYGHQHTFAFPQAGVSVLTVADHKGSEQIAGWVQPLKQRFPEGLPIEGVADVSRVPRLLRPLVRKRFVEKIEHPVMLDWEGKVVNHLECRSGVANVFLLSTNGAVLLTLHGVADDQKLRKLQSMVVIHDLKAAAADKPALTSSRPSGPQATEAARR